MNLFNLVAKLTVDTSDYEKGLKNAEKQGENTAKKTEVTFKGASAVTANAIMNIAEKAFSVIQNMANKAMELVNFADRFSDLSAQYDISTEALQEFEYIAGQSSTSTEEMLSAMTIMYNKAKEGDAIFDKLGISVKNANGEMKPMNELFWEAKSALDNVEGSGDKSATMLELFGRNAMSLGEVLRKDTSELVGMADRAHELGIVLSEDTIQKASDFNDKLTELKQQGKSAFIGLLLNEEGAEEKFDNFVQNMIGNIQKQLPKLTKTAVNILAKIFTALIEALPDMALALQDALVAIDWGNVIWKIVKSLLTVMVNNFINLLRFMIKPITDFFHIDTSGWVIKGDTFRESTTEITNTTQSSASRIVDNSTNNITVNMQSSGDPSYDARQLANEIAKIYSTSGQTRGR